MQHICPLTLILSQGRGNKGKKSPPRQSSTATPPKFRRGKERQIKSSQIYTSDHRHEQNTRPRAMPTHQSCFVPPLERGAWGV